MHDVVQIGENRQNDLKRLFQMCSFVGIVRVFDHFLDQRRCDVDRSSSPLVYFEQELILSDALNRFEKITVQREAMAERLLSFLCETREKNDQTWRERKEHLPGRRDDQRSNVPRCIPIENDFERILRTDENSISTPDEK